MIQLRALRPPPPESDLDDEQIRNMLASPLYLQEREASADRSRVYHSFRENSVSSSSHFRESAGKLAAMFSHKRKSSQETLSDREGISSGHQPVQGKDETLFRFSDLEEAARLVLEEQRDHPLAEAKSEILKQECKVDTLNTCIREFQRQAHSNRLEMDMYVNYGYEESRREQAWTSRRICSTRKSTSRYSHPKYPWSGRIEESSGPCELIDFSRTQELRESHATFQSFYRSRKEWTSWTISGSCRIDLQWKIITRSQLTGNWSKSLQDAEPRPKFATWYMEFAWYIGKRFWQSTCSNRFVIDTLSRNASLLESKCYRRKSSAR